MTTVLLPGRFFGAVEERHTTGPFLLVETRHARDDRIPAHRHDRPYFCLVLEGGYNERAGDGAVTCRPDTVVFHPSGVTHEDHFGAYGGRCFNLECESSWLRDRNSGLEALKSPLYLRDDYSAWLSRRLRGETIAVGAYSSLAIDGLARALVASVARLATAAPQADASIGPAGPDWLQEAVALARREYAGNVGLAHVARRVGVHPRQLARTFRELMGCTLGEFVRRRRIEAACRLLRESDDALASIAFRTGFADQSHLTRTFKRHVGTTPSAYRRHHHTHPPHSNTPR